MNATLSLIPRPLARRRAAVFVALLLTGLLARAFAEPSDQGPTETRRLPELSEAPLISGPELPAPAEVAAGAQPPSSVPQPQRFDASGHGGVLFSAPDGAAASTSSPPSHPPSARSSDTSQGVAFSTGSEAPTELTSHQQRGPMLGLKTAASGVAFSAPGAMAAEVYLPQPPQLLNRWQDPPLGVSFSVPGTDPYPIEWTLFQLADDGTSADTGDGSTSETDDEQTLGEAPEETNSSVQFLRQDTILLDPGQCQFDITFQYLVDETDFTLAQLQGNVLAIAEARRRERLVLIPIEFRLGITPVLQFFVNVPFGYSNSEFVFQAFDDVSSSGGIGDVSAGLTKQLVDGDEIIPDVLATAAFSAPTGKSSFATSLSTPGSSLGQGFWTSTLALTCIQTYDPIVVFYGFGYRHRFEATFNNNLTGGRIGVNPGKQAFYRFGAGFAVNPKVTLSASFIGSYIAANRVNGVRVAGGAQEPMQVRLATTIVRKEKSKGRRVKTVEPFVNLGLTEGSIDSLFGVSWTH